MTYLDTHVAVWLYQGDGDLLSRAARHQLESGSLLISPAVLLELEYLHEIKRLKPSGAAVVNALSDDLGLEICEFAFSKVVHQSLREKWPGKLRPRECGSVAVIAICRTPSRSGMPIASSVALLR